MFWQKVLSKHQGQTILIVAHGGTNRALINTAIGLQPDNRLGSSNFIDLLLTEHSISESLAQKLAVKYQIPHLPLAENHLSNWQQTIINRQKLPISLEQPHLTTGLIIASDKLITRILKNTFQINISHTQDSLTVIHYPQTTNHQILQGILPLTSQAIALTK